MSVHVCLKEESTEVVEGVELGDLKEMMQSADNDSTNPLAAAAAEYAKTRNTIAASEKVTELGMTEQEIAMVTVIATFLAVHPLGATIGDITRYFQAFNPQSSGYYLQGLLTRLPQVFQMSQSSEDMEPRWWFLGYQSTSQTTAYSQDQSEEDQITVEMTD